MAATPTPTPTTTSAQNHISSISAQNQRAVQVVIRNRKD
jgi:hypothetical protein